MSHVLINKALRRDIPSDAVVLTRSEALAMQWDIIYNWKQKSVTWPFTFGVAVLASMNAATNLKIIHHYRDKLQLRHYGRITMALPATVIPSILSVVTHHYYVSNAILLGEECPLCIQTRAAALQVGVGAVMPFVTTPILAFVYADLYATYNVPAFKLANFPQLFNLWVSIARKFKSTFPIIIGINAITASALAYYEADSFYKIQSVLYEKEERFKRMMAERVSSQV